MKALKMKSLKQVNSEVMLAENMAPHEPAEETPLPPPPRQFNKPVGPPPGPVEAPKDFEGYVDIAKKARAGRLDMAQLWAALAQADAMNRVAKGIDRLNEFLGTYDNDENPEEDSTRLFDVLVAAQDPGLLDSEEVDEESADELKKS